MSFYSIIVPERIDEAVDLLEKHIGVEYQVDENCITIFEMYDDEPKLWNKLLVDNKLYYNEEKPKDPYGMDKVHFKVERRLDWNILFGEKDINIIRLCELFLKDKTINLQAKEVFKDYYAPSSVPIELILKLDGIFEGFNIKGFRELSTTSILNVIKYLKKHYTFRYDVHENGTHDVYVIIKEDNL